MIASSIVLDASRECQAFACVACGSAAGEVLCRGIRDWEYGVAGEWDHVRCRGCGIVSLYPFPDERTIRRAYPDDYASWTEQPGRQSLLHRLRGIYVTRRDRYLANLIAPDGSLLDVGCGDGLTLERARKLTTGTVVGIDISPHAAAVARAKGFDVHCGTLVSMPEDREAFDLILMNGYLEHSWTPGIDLGIAHRLLKPGGRILGIVPNYASLDRRLFGRYWAGTHAPRHLLQFTPETLSALLKEQGFERPRFAYMLAPTYIALSIQNWLQSGAAGSRFQTRLRNGRALYYPMLLAAALPIHLVFSMLGVGGLMKFQATKEGAPAP